MQVIKNLKCNILCWGMLFLLTGCGYQTSSCCAFNEGGPMTIAIPLIKGDEMGDLRNDLAKGISRTSGLVYSSNPDARYRLDVKILEDTSETIGYAWDEDPITGKFIKRLYPNEGRRKVKASASLYDTELKKVVIVPFVVEGASDFDFVNPTALKNVEFVDISGKTQTVLHYSLGQLDSEEGAKQESFRPLSKTLASKIVNFLKRSSHG